MEIIKQVDNDGVTFKAKLNGETIGECDSHPSTYPATEFMGRTRAFKRWRDKNVHICWLGVNKGHTGKYVGTRLLYRTLRYHYRRGYRYVTLLDGSARSGMTNSIYRKIGLTYSKKSNGEESSHMIGNIRHILYGKFRGMNGKDDRSDRFYRRKEIVSSI